ncbi:MAG: AIR synthase family protein [Lachnospiraceae bacterium]|nr:AIR synthase family protein [Lachnospiraceae bacterium]
MKKGKLSEAVLDRAVFKIIRHRRKEVVLRPGIGLDCAGLVFEPDEAIVMSTDPITGAAKDIGTLAVHITANDLASNGADPVGIMVTALLPERLSESKFKVIMKDIEAVCAKLDMEVIGGHTEVTDVVNSPVISITGVGKIKKDKMLSPKNMKPGYDIVMTKYAGLEGSAIISASKEEELKERYPSYIIDNAKSFIEEISVVEDSRIAMSNGAVFMHDVTEGGIFGALWEVAGAAKMGLKVDLKKIPIRQETVEICEYFDINPYMLISSGSMLIVTEDGSHMVEALMSAGINAAVVGKLVEGKDRIIVNGEETRYLESPSCDELYKVK